MFGCFCLLGLLQRALDHYTLALQRRCFCSWLQSVDEAHAEREASANQLYHRILLQRAVCSWKRVKHPTHAHKHTGTHTHTTPTPHTTHTHHTHTPHTHTNTHTHTHHTHTPHTHTHNTHHTTHTHNTQHTHTHTHTQHNTTQHTHIVW